jgi:hypothetical protein
LAAEKRSVDNAINSLAASETAKLKEFVSFARSNNTRVLVRSNAPNEDLTNRGAHRSYAVDCNIDAISEAINAVLGSGSSSMFVILQHAIEPGTPGHMSNERRVTSLHNRWLVEGLYHSEVEQHQQFIRATKQKDVGDPLFARTDKQLLDRLRGVAGWLTQTGKGQYHCEWVWDGARAWIVQCDDASAVLASPLAIHANEYLTRVEHWTHHNYDPPPPISCYYDTSDDWSKLERPKTFKRLGLPTGDVYFVSGSVWVESNPKERAQLLSELCKLSQHPIVIRCDIAKAATADDLLLPTSAASSDVAELADFSCRTIWLARHSRSALGFLDCRPCTS